MSEEATAKLAIVLAVVFFGALTYGVLATLAKMFA